MRPLLRDGSLIAVTPVDAATPLHVGEVVVARHPDRPEITMVKRILMIEADGTVFLDGDNSTVSTDSWRFGPVARDLILARARWRYWPLPIRRLSRRPPPRPAGAA
ncbi:MAG: S26 family signal peptidase [Candidatus Dormibacteraeota bacterium]|nr:S26 family signal peptidase [Candidatus Dormibacteraeota bacterium]